MDQSLLVTAMYMFVFVVVFYVFLIRPQQKKSKELTDMRSSLAVGMRIVTIGGLCGRIVRIDEDEVVIETGDGTSLTFKKWAVGSIIE